MIISHKHKFIFIKPQKTAGTSVELLLSRICGNKDVITPLGFDPDRNVRKRNHAREPDNYKRLKNFKYWEVRDVYHLVTKWILPRLNYNEHLKADSIRLFLGLNVWNEYKKISIVRNPWDHAISQYNWMVKYNFGGVSKDFLYYLRYEYKLLWPFYTIQNSYEIDYMIRFENLEIDLLTIFGKLGIEDLGDLPVTKSSSRQSGSYRPYYDEVSKEIVRYKNLNIIEKFDYEF